MSPLSSANVAESMVKAKNTSRKLGFWILVVIVLYLLFKSVFVFVPPGYVGVYYDRGRGVLPQTAKEGLAMKIPLWQSIYFFDKRIQEYTMSIAPDEGALRRDDSLDAPTSDGQTVKIDATIIFKIDEEKASELLSKVGPDYIEKLIRPMARSEVRMTVSKFTAPEIYSAKRREAESLMKKSLTELLGEQNIIVTQVLLRGVYFTPEYSKSIEDKMIAEQKVKQAAFEVQEATQRAEAKIAEAKGLAEAQNLQKASLTAEYLQLEATKKWDGKLPQYVGSGSVPFVNIPTK